MKIRQISSILFLGLVCLLGNSSYGQIVGAYAGSYALVCGYTAHYYNSLPYKGTFGMGVLTIRSNGSASYSASFNFNGYDLLGYRLSPFIGAGTGAVGSRGGFTFRNGVSGSGGIIGTTVGALGGGTFNDLVGNGVWFVSRYR